MRIYLVKGKSGRFRKRKRARGSHPGPFLANEREALSQYKLN